MTEGPPLAARGLKLRQLQLIVDVADTGQVVAAAQRLNMTQPAASRMLSELEHLLGVKLTARHPRGVNLTPAGTRLAELARGILREIDTAATEVRDINSGKAGFVSLGSVSGPSLDLVLPVMQNLRIMRPQIRFDVMVDSSDRLAAQLIAGGVNFYLGRIPDHVDAAKFTMQTIGPEPMSLIVRAGHELDLRPPSDLTETLRFDWVMQPRAGLLRRTVETYLMERGLPLPQRVVGTASLMFTLALVIRSNAIGVMSTQAEEFFRAQESLGAHIVRLPVAPALMVAPYGLVTMHERKLTPAAEIAYRAIAEAAGLSAQAGAAD